MSLLHPHLAWFALLGAIPVILHLLLRPRPKRLLFPALRLLEQRRRQSVHRLRLRHVWLLLLRILVLLAIVFTVARPRLPPANYAPTALETGTAAAILLLAAGLEIGARRLWSRQRLSQSTLLTRRAWLRTGVVFGGLLLLGLLVVWPMQRRIFAEIRDPHKPAGNDLPVAAVLLFDTSLSMQYRSESLTRIEQAREIATQHVRRLPAGSRIAVTDLATSDEPAWSPDLSAAVERIKTIDLKASAQPLNDRIRALLEFQLDERAGELESQAGLADEARQDSHIREIYVMTDLAASGWRRDDPGPLREALAAAPEIGLYLIDVGVLQPQNLGIASLRLSSEVVPVGGQLIVQATLKSAGAAPAAANAAGSADHRATVEVYLENETGRLVKQGQSDVVLRGREGTVASFDLRGLTGSVRQGEVRIASADPLPFDDVAPFTVEIQSPPEILVVAPNREEAQYWMTALAPRELEQLGKPRYKVQWLPPDRLARTPLTAFQVVCLLNVPALDLPAWEALERFVAAGGGLFVAPGALADAANYNSPAAQSVLPAELIAFYPFRPPEYLDLANVNHPLLKEFADWGVADLTSVEIHRHWRVKTNDAGVVAPYTDERRSPAILDRIHVQGRVVMLTTSVNRSGWNDLPAAGWQFVAFADQTTRYLSRQSDRKLNLVIGEEALIPIQSPVPVERYLLRRPNLTQTRHDVPPRATTLTIRPDLLGSWRIAGLDAASAFDRGFSVLPEPRERELARLTASELDDLLGKDRYGTARSLEELNRTVVTGRIGKEVSPWIFAVMVLAFLGELVFANRFYEEAGEPARGMRPAAAPAPAASPEA